MTLDVDDDDVKNVCLRTSLCFDDGTNFHMSSTMNTYPLHRTASILCCLELMSISILLLLSNLLRRELNAAALSGLYLPLGSPLGAATDLVKKLSF